MSVAEFVEADDICFRRAILIGIYHLDLAGR